MKQEYLCFTLSIFLLLFSSCELDHPFSQTDSDNGPDVVQNKIEEMLVEHGKESVSGAELLKQMQNNYYQTDGKIEKLRNQNKHFDLRQQAMDVIIKRGSISLNDCLVFALEFNDQIQAKRSTVRAVKAEAVIAHSRFLPQLSYSLENKSTHSEDTVRWTNEREHTIGLTQNLLEFGKENVTDVELRDEQQKALFDYEDEVRNVLADVRTRFFTVILRNKQISERKKLLEDFQKNYEKSKSLEAKGKVLEVDVLTARLNVLNEEERINSLEKEMLRQKIDLHRSAGFPLGSMDIKLSGKWTPLSIDLEEAVKLGLRRSTKIAQARVVLAEQLRTARQSLWGFFPDMTLRAGRNRNGTDRGGELTSEDGRLGLSGFLERKIKSRPAGSEYDLDDKYINVDIELPLFDGFERAATYRQERHKAIALQYQLRDVINEVELDIRKAYQTLLERKKRLEILKETVKISRERLRVQEKLKELGKISDDSLETFRDRYFSDQDSFFAQQIVVMAAQESLRSSMRCFEDISAKQIKSSSSKEE